MKKLINYFLKGLVIFVPAVFTIAILLWAFTSLDTVFRQLFKIKIPGLGIVITIAAVTFIGFIASNFIGKKFFSLIESLFTRLPLVKLLYSAIKDFLNAFAGERKTFDKPVLVELAPSGPIAMGFVTRQSLQSLGLAEHVAVYFPQSYNFAGSVLIFPAEKVKPLDLPGSEAMTFIVSGGLAGPDHPNPPIYTVPS